MVSSDAFLLNSWLISSFLFPCSSVNLRLDVDSSFVHPSTQRPERGWLAGQRLRHIQGADRDRRVPDISESYGECVQLNLFVDCDTDVVFGFECSFQLPKTGPLTPRRRTHLDHGALVSRHDTETARTSFGMCLTAHQVD